MTLREEPQPESSDARMRWKLKDGKLTVYSQKSGLTIPTRAKQLTIGIPGRPGREAAEAQPRPQRSYGLTPGTDAP